MSRRLALLALPAILLLSACDQASNGDPALKSFASCGELEAHLKAETTRLMNARIDDILRGMALGAEDTRSLAGAAPAATSYTTTNTQERGVDEPDFVKNDGSRIFLLQGSSLVVLSAWPPTSLSIQSETPVEGYPVSMFLDGRRLVVFSSISDPIPIDGPALRVGPVVRYRERTKLTAFDVSGSRPLPVHELYLDEGYRDARKTGRFVRLVTTTYDPGPELRYWPDREVDWSDPAAVRAAYEELRAANTRTIREASLDEWLPAISERRAGAQLETVARECSAFHASGARTDLGITTVASLDLDRLDQRSSFLSVLSPVSEVYSSREALYLTARNEGWWREPAPGQIDPDRTYLHRFTYDAQRVRYTASGSVPGEIADQFSMDEQDGYLRVATTQGSAWDTARPATSGVYVLRAIRGALTQVGALAGLAPGERLFSARFEGARGYLVTFRQIDPLFTLDLRTPATPRLAGELKVPGFSTYIHPIDPGHLLTIGRDVSEDGRTQNGLQLEIFDVSDLAHPTLMHKLVSDSRNSYSEAAYDHKAFNFFAARGLLAIPFTDWSERGTYRSSIEVYRVSTERGIEPVGSVDHLELSGVPTYPGWTPYVRRSVMMEDYVYSISWEGVKVNDVRDLARTVASVHLPQPPPVYVY